MVSKILVYCNFSLKLQAWEEDEKHPKLEIRSASKPYDLHKAFNIWVIASFFLKMEGLDCIDLRYISSQGFQFSVSFFFPKKKWFPKQSCI